MANTLSETYTKSILNLDSTNGAWVQFVRDHINLIKYNHSSWTTIAPDVMNKYQYRLRDFLHESKINTGLTWLIMDINNLRGSMDFTDLDQILIPDAAYIEQLHNKYITIVGNQLKQ